MNNAEQFVKTGIFELEYPEDLRKKVLEALEAWKSFVSLNDSVSDLFPYANGVGYENQKGGGPTADRKKDFHYTDDGADFLWKSAIEAPGALAPVAQGLISKAQELVAYLGPTAHGFAHQVGQEVGIPDFSQEVLASRGSWFLRFLYYPGDREVGESMAVPHIDKSAFTFHLYESDPGLQALSYDGEWINTPVSESKTIIFPGFQLQHKTKGKVKALCHRVVATEKTKGTGRYSMVVFFSLKNTRKYNKANGRLQDFKPGFNYNLSSEEVDAMFV